jgi:phage protein D
LVTEIEVEQLSDGVSSFKIILDDADDAFSEQKTKIMEGDSCVIKLGYYETKLEQVIEGKVTGVKQDRKEFTRKTYTVTGFDGLQLLARGRVKRSFEEVKDTDLAQIVADECGLGADFEDSGIVHPFVVQNNINNLTFLYERARRIGFEVKVVGRNLAFRKPKREKTSIVLRYDGSKAVDDPSVRILQRCDITATTMNVPEEVVVRSYDPKGAKEIIASSTDLNGGAMAKDAATKLAKEAAGSVKTKIQISDQPVYSTEEAKRLAESILNQRADEYQTGTGSCEGDPGVSCGNIVTIKDVDPGKEGEYYVKSATHTLKVGGGTGFGYWTKFSVSRNAR